MPIVSKDAHPNLKRGTDKNPVIIEEIAPFLLNLPQKSDKISVGQNVAAMPDHPKITNQKMVLSGVVTATIMATSNANIASKNVMILEILASSSSVLFGLKIC